MPTTLSILKGASFIFIGMIASKLLTFALRIIIAKLGPEAYGLFSIGLSVHGLFVVLSLVGLDYSVTRYVAYYKGNNNKIIEVIISSAVIGLISGIILSILILNFSKYISISFFKRPELDDIIRLFAWIIPLSVTSSLCMAIIRAYKKVKYIVYVNNLFNNGLKLVLTFLFITMSFSIIGVVWAYIISLILTVIIYLYLIRKNLIDFVPDTFHFKLFHKKIFAYSWPLIFVSMIISLLTWSDSIVLGNLNLMEEVGIYNAALNIVMFMTMIPSALQMLLIPSINELWAKKDISEINIICKSVTKWILFSNLLFTIGICVFAKYIMVFVFGSDYVSGTNTLITLSFAFLFFTLSQTGSDILNMMDKTKLVSLNVIIALGINIALSYFFYNIFGSIGISIATLTSLFLYLIMIVIEIRSISDINLFGKNLFAIVDEQDKEIFNIIKHKINNKFRTP